MQTLRWKSGRRVGLVRHLVVMKEQEKKDPEMDVAGVKKVLDEFGPKLIELAIPVWKIQAGALERQDFTKTRNDGRKKQPYWPKKGG